MLPDVLKLMQFLFFLKLRSIMALERVACIITTLAEDKFATQLLQY